MIYYDWFFPPGISFYDSHYSVVHNLWKTVERYIPPNPIARNNIHLCISPFSALEMFRLLKVKSEQLTRIKVPRKVADYSQLILQVGTLYTAISEIMQNLESHPDKGPLLTAFNKKHIEPLRSFIEVDILNKTEIRKVMGRDLNIRTGYEEIIKLREKKYEQADPALSATFDMANLGLITFLRDKSEELSMFPIITTHGLYTIFGWEQAVRDPNKKSYGHSLLALYLFKGLHQANDLDVYSDVIDGALGMCREYLKHVKKNECFEKKMPAEAKVILSRREVITLDAWNEVYQEPYFGLEKFPSSQARPKPTSEDLDGWHDGVRKQQREAIREKVKLIERRANFIDPDLVSVLVDKDELVDEVLDYARP